MNKMNKMNKMNVDTAVSAADCAPSLTRWRGVEEPDPSSIRRVDGGLGLGHGRLDVGPASAAAAQLLDVEVGLADAAQRLGASDAHGPHRLFGLKTFARRRRRPRAVKLENLNVIIHFLTTTPHRT